MHHAGDYEMKKVEVLGPGCPKCQELMKRTEQAVRELGLECQVEKVSDIMKITTYGVMMTPALVVDGEVVLVGKVPESEDIKKLLTK
jgi:small redox-active disulfide protein 2